MAKKNNYLSKEEQYQFTLESSSKSSQARLTASRVIVYVVLVFISILCLIPFWILIVNASRSHAQLMGGFSFLPSGSFFYNLKNLLNDANLNMGLALWNSLLVATLAAAFSVYFSSLTAYGVFAYNFRGRQFVFTFIMVVMMIPSQVPVLGFLKLISNLNMTDTLVALYLPAIAAPVTFFYMLQYLRSSISLEIVEAARVDGSGEFWTFNRIVFPLMKPAIAVQAIFSFTASWNNYFVPALVISSKEKRTIPIIIAQLRSADYSKFDMGQVYITVFIAIIPLVIVYFFLSKFIIKGVTLGGVKG